MFISRPRILQAVRARLKTNPIVTLLGPRQCGKTTIAEEIASSQPGDYFDLENPVDLARLDQPQLALENKRGLIVLDEIQFKPDLFPLLRVLADRKPLPARFLLLGSASPDLVRGVSESLAGRTGFVDMGGFDLSEVGVAAQSNLWWRGCFPRAYLSKSDEEARAWQEDFIRTFLERDLRRYGIEIPVESMRRLWTMIAHDHGQTWNGAEIGRSLGEAHSTVKRHLDVLSGALVVRQLPPWFENLGKRQVKSPKIYVRDSGLLHALLRLPDPTALEGHPKLGASWEGFALEQVLRITGERDGYFWATQSGAELDLFCIHRGKRLGFEFKYADAPKTTKSMRVAMTDLRLDRLYAVHPGKRSYALDQNLEALALRDLWDRLG
jgi:predicted AAA+ superfamily ATPase